MSEQPIPPPALEIARRYIALNFESDYEKRAALAREIAEYAESDFANYMYTKSEVRTAVAEHNYAGVKLDRAMIYERMAEIRSQHEPLNALCEGDRAKRELCIAAAHFVVYGRFPVRSVKP